MIYQVIFRPDAVEDVVKAAAWYDERSPGLAEELVDEFSQRQIVPQAIQICLELFAPRARFVGS